MRAMRWVAVLAWLAVAVFAFMTYLSDEFRTIADLGTTAICLAAAALIARGSRLGETAALLGGSLAVLGGVGALAWGRWPAVGAAAALVIVSFLAAREINRDRARPR
jgi:hypothetical protein